MYFPSRSSITWRSSATLRTISPASPASDPKTAAKWLNQYQTLDSLIAHAADISGKVGENLRNELPMLELSRKLATIDTTLALEITTEQLEPGAPDTPRLARAVHAHGIAGPAQGSGAGSRPAAPGTAEIDVVIAEVAARRADGRGAIAVVSTRSAVRDYHKILAQQEFDAWLKNSSAAPLISFDTETDSLAYMQAQHRRRVISP